MTSADSPLATASWLGEFRYERRSTERLGCSPPYLTRTTMMIMTETNNGGAYPNKSVIGRDDNDGHGVIGG